MIKSYLLYKDRDFNLDFDISAEINDKIIDLELKAMAKVMDNKDSIKIMLKPLQNREEIIWRQDIAKDSIENIETITEVSKICLEALMEEKSIPHGIFGDYPNNRISRGLKLIGLFLEKIEGIKDILNRGSFKSEGYQNLLTRLNNTLTEVYMANIREAMEFLLFKDGIYIEGKLGRGNKPVNLRLMRRNGEKNSFIQKLLKRKEGESFLINERDDAGFEDLTEIKNKSLNEVGTLIQNSIDGLKEFCETLKFELDFYIGVEKLYNKVKGLGYKVVWPEASEDKIEFTEMKSISLCLKAEGEVVGNTVDSIEKDLFIITGANRGGKTTFLRSIGESQIFFQCGIFVIAEFFKSRIYSDIWTHFKRSEDIELKNGKLEEELERMDRVMKNIDSTSMVLFNESFSSTNERDGGIISRNVSLGLVDSGVTVFFVTHNYEFSRNVYNENREDTFFMRASRERSFKLEVGEPFKKSYGEDIFNKYFKEE